MADQTPSPSTASAGIRPVASFADDKLGLQPFAERLEKFLLVERDFVEGSLVVSLGAPFGFGKTTFLRMWKADLEKRMAESPHTSRPILLNAWESDYCGDPLLAIVTGLIRAVESKVGDTDTTAAGKLRDAARNVGWFAIALGNSFVASTTGIDALAAKEFAEAQQAVRKPERPDFVALYEGRVEALAHLKRTLAEVFNGGKAPAIVMVDELDRCRPDYAISYLETIKHVFDIPGLIFVLAVDYDHLANSARALFGPKLKFEEYYRKFVQRELVLPPIDQSGFNRLAGAYAQEYLGKIGKRACWIGPDDRHRIENITELVGALKLTPRQLQEMFRIVAHSLEREKEQNEGTKLLWSIGTGTILLAALKVGQRDLYNSIARYEQDSHSALSRFLLDRLGLEEARWWSCVYITGAFNSPDDYKAGCHKVFELFGARDKEQVESFERGLGQFAQGWGYSSSGRIQKLCRIIDSVDKL